MKLMTLKGVAAELRISPRQIHRLKDAGHMPQPIRIGRVLRWRAADIDAWVADGCPRVVTRKRVGQ